MQAPVVEGNLFGLDPIHQGTAEPNAEGRYSIQPRAAWRCTILDCHTLLNTSVPLVPPNPKEFERTVSIFMGRAAFGT